MSEYQIQQEILREFGARPDMRIWRNNTGTGYSLDGGRIITFGLKGSADILGILTGGRFLGIEVKTSKGRQSKEQVSFQRMIEGFGGLYILARSTQDVALALAAEGF